MMPILLLAQAPTNFPYGIKNAAASENSTPTYIVTQEVDGVHKKTPASLFLKPTPTLQEVTEAGAITTVPTTFEAYGITPAISVNLPNAFRAEGIKIKGSVGNYITGISIENANLVMNGNGGIFVASNETAIIGAGVFGGVFDGSATGLFASGGTGQAAIFSLNGGNTSNIVDFKSTDENLYSVSVAAVQNDGRIMAKAGIEPNDVVVKGQLDSAVSSIPTPTLQSVTEAGSITNLPIRVMTDVANARAIYAYSNSGFGSYNSSYSSFGSYNKSNSGCGSYNLSDSGIASIHEIRNSNINNISEFKNAGILQAAITHDGRIIHSPAVNANESVTLGQVQLLIATPAITTVLANNTGASLGALNANTTVNLNLNTNSIWTTNTTASKTGATVAEIIDPATGRIKDVADKNLNTIRVVIEYSQSGGAGDGVLTGQLVNPSGVVIDQESEPINVNGTAETNVRGTFRFFVVKTSDNNLGYTLRLSNGAKALTAYRIVSVLRNNNP